VLTPDLLRRLHEYELARASMLGERPLAPDQLIKLAEHMEALAAASDDWVDQLVAQADAAEQQPRHQARQAPHVGASRV
jgi:hypothetical protein